MLIEIKSCCPVVLYSGEHDSLKEAAGEIVRAKISLAHANLYNANLSRIDLSRVDLSHANLACANFFHSTLSNADLSHANLSRVNFSYADLTYADLSYADLSYTNFPHADLFGANLLGVHGDIATSPELLALIAVRFDPTLAAVASMIAGHRLGCWKNYTTAILKHFGKETMLRLRKAWSQDESWKIVERMDKHGWPKDEVVE